MSLRRWVSCHLQMPRHFPAHMIPTPDWQWSDDQHWPNSLTQVNVSEALGSNGVSRVLVYALQAQAGQLGFIKEPRLETGEGQHHHHGHPSLPGMEHEEAEAGDGGLRPA